MKYTDEYEEMEETLINILGDVESATEFAKEELGDYSLVRKLVSVQNKINEALDTLDAIKNRG